MSEGILRLVEIGIGVVGVPLILVSVVLLLRQTRHSVRQLDIANRVAVASIYQNAVSQMSNIDSLLVEHPELRNHFYDDLEAGDQEEARLMSLAEMFVDLMDGVITQMPCLPDYPWETWEKYFHDLMASSQTLQRFWNKHREWYSPELQQFLDPIAAQYGGIES